MFVRSCVRLTEAPSRRRRRRRERERRNRRVDGAYRAGEIGLRQVQTGEIRPVKVLGVLAMIDDDETDWKVVACVEINQYVVCTR